MSNINKPNTFSANTTISSAEVNANFDTIYNDYNGNISATNLATDAVTTDKIADGAVTADKLASGIVESGWVDLGATPNTVTYNGNRSYDLVFNSTDLTDTLSPGMRLKTTRTVAAPTQCTDLEAGSSQYWNDTSVSGITFTDDFVCGAWVKVESYVDMGIISRYNGTSGWSLYMNSDGTVSLVGYNAGSSNYSLVQSYQSLPLGKWVHVTAQLDMSAFTATSTTSYIMIDGVDVPAKVLRSGTNPTALVQAGNLEVGTRNALIPFDGKLAQVFVSSAKITQANVRTLISQGLTASLISTHSIASAYSFNGNATDLNTTSANNLTAQGSAVATNADSPYGTQGSGLIDDELDYGIVMAATFSTNTTVTVQVPEGCTIPTSGGVSAVSYSTQKAPYGFPGWDGVLATVYMMSAFSGSSGTTAAMNGYSMTVTPPIGKKVIVSLTPGVGLSNTSAADLRFGICHTSVADANRLSQINTGVSANGSAYSNPTAEEWGTGTSRTYLGIYSTTTGTLTVNGSTISPSVFKVEVPSMAG